MQPFEVIIYEYTKNKWLIYDKNGNPIGFVGANNEICWDFNKIAEMEGLNT